MNTPESIAWLIYSGLIFFISQTNGIKKNQECGLSDSKTAMPWVINIYQSEANGNHEYICSGSLVSKNIILTAASCFYDEATKEIKHKKFSISAGQNFKAWIQNKGDSIQLREIPRENISIKKQFKGSAGKFSHNIAVILMNSEQAFDFTSMVKNVCVYWDNDFIESELSTINIPLKIIYWLNRPNSNNNTAYDIIEPTYMEQEMCYNYVSSSFREFLTFDKMCVQLSDQPGGSILGAGLYAFHTIKLQWFLIGIASESTAVNSKTYITFTQLQPHLNWISNIAYMYI